jgi:dTDP-4-amino-4,6-dideoxygalactose transaminase
MFSTEFPLHVGRPNIGSRQPLLKRIDDILDQRRLSNNGKYVQEFEKRVAELLGVKHCVATCNATIGLEIASRALGLKGEVIVPSFTFVATAHSLQWQGITPVFCDVDPLTHNIDPGKIEALITPRTTGILGVHLWGRGCDVDAIQEIADRHGLHLLFDASHAFGCSHKGKMIGGFGRAEVFSFHATKFINTLEGGVVTTNDDDLVQRVRHMKNFGFIGYDQVDSIGTNGKMNEISAAVGLTNLESLSDFIAINRRNYSLYLESLNDASGLHVMPYPEDEQCNYQYVVVKIDAAVAGISRDELVQFLHNQGIIARRYFHPGCHRMEPYRSLFPQAGQQLKQTELLSETIFCLPTGSAISSDDIAAVSRLILSVIPRK